MSEIDFEEKLPDGRVRYQVLKNKSIYDHAVGHIITAPKTGLITKETSPLMHARKAELARELAVEGIDEAALAKGLIPKAGTGRGWKAVCQHVTATLLESKNLRGQAEAASFLGRASGYASPETDALGIAERLAAILQSFQRKTIDAEVRDVVG